MFVIGPIENVSIDQSIFLKQIKKFASCFENFGRTEDALSMEFRMNQNLYNPWFEIEYF